MRAPKIFKDKAFLSLFFFLSIFIIRLNLQADIQEKEEKQKEKQKKITEEILVVAELPREQPISSISSIKREIIEALSPRDLSEVLSFASGAFVSMGTKGEFTLKIRGLDSQRIVLLYDGIPVYEPYFNSFDLKTITAEEVESVRIIKSASSVLYGPNALGGVVEVITRRPDSPSFSLKTLYSNPGMIGFSSSAGFNWRNIFLSGFASFDKSDGYYWHNKDRNALRFNSDFERKNITGKLYFYPGKKSEILFEAGHYSSEFGLPPATDHYSPRFWRFKNWSRSQFNLGGTFSLPGEGTLKVRGYFVTHKNTLDAFTDADMNELQWESRYRNGSFGTFLLGSVPYLSGHEWKFSLNIRDDFVRIQPDRGTAWEEFRHMTISAGAENHFSLAPKWKLVAGTSLDFLKKQTGKNKTTLNPILGLKFYPEDHVDFRLTLSRKSRFPSMKSLYSSPGGNPELTDEKGTTYELGLTYDRNVQIHASLFSSSIRDLIHATRRPDGYVVNWNIGRARISGFEIDVQKPLPRALISLGYTRLDGRNLEEKRPLDLTPKSRLNFTLDLFTGDGLRISVWGLGVSSSELKIRDETVGIPGYFVLHASLSQSFSRMTLLLKAENIFNSSYVTEPGFPMKARTISLGLQFRLEKGRE